MLLTDGALMRVFALNLIAVALLAACAAAPAAPGENLLEDPGFEKGPWPQSAAWHGEITSVAENPLSGEKAGKLVAGPEGDASIYSGYIPCTVGLRYRFTIQAKGAGTISLRSIQLTTDPENRYIIERPDNHMELTDEWQQIAIDISPEEPIVQKLAVVVQLDGEAATAFLDDALLTVLGMPGGELRMTPGYAMVAPGQSVSFDLAASCDEGPITEGLINATISIGEAIERREITMGGETTSWSWTAPEDVQPGQVAISVVNAEVGIGQSAWVDVVDAETYAQFEAAAQAAQIDTPAHVLFLGDSLTDGRRGHNYTDIVGFWLQKVHGDVTYRNAGAGGDYITRVWQRMQGQETYKTWMYDNLFEPTPTRVFIWLGHNDSKLKPKPEYTSPEDYPFDPVVPLDTFEETFVTVIEHIREHAPDAKFTIISASSSVHEITRATVVKRIEERGNGGSYFGKPDVLEAFNERMQAVAEATSSDYLDVYAPTRDHPDKLSIFTADGVHINDAGNRFVAKLILGYLGE